MGRCTLFTGETNCKYVILPPLLCKFNAIPVKMPTREFWKVNSRVCIGKKIKCAWKINLWKWSGNMGLLALLDIKTYCKAKVIKQFATSKRIVRKMGQIYFRNRHNTHRNLLYNKVGISDVGE